MKTVLSFCLVFNFLLVATGARGQVVDTAAVRAEVDSLLQASNFAAQRRMFDKAFELLFKGERLIIENLSKESVVYGNLCHLRGIIWYHKRDFQNAETSWLEALAVREKVLGSETLSYAAVLNNLAILYLETGQFIKSEEMHIKAKDIREKILGKESIEYALSLYNLAHLYVTINNFEKAEPLLIQSLEIRGKTLGTHHPDYVASLIGLGILNMEIGDYVNAERYLLEAKSITENEIENKKNNQVTVLNNIANRSIILYNLANLYQKTGKFEIAESILLEEKSAKEKIYGKKHPEYGKVLNGLGILYHQMGNYDKAESMYLESLEIKEQALNKININHPEIANYLVNLVIFYRETGNYKKSEMFGLRAKKILENSIGTDTPDYANCLNGLANLYIELNEFEVAEKLLDTVNVIFKKSLGTHHPNYAANLTAIASLCSKIGKYEKAERVILEAQEICAERLGKHHPAYATILNNSAGLFFNREQYEKSEIATIAAKDIYKEVFGGEHPEYAVSLSNLINIYIAMGDYDKSDPLIDELSKINQSRIYDASCYSSTNELFNILQILLPEQNQLLSFTQLAGGASKNAAKLSFNNSLFFKGFVLYTTDYITHLANSDTVATNELFKLKSYLRRLDTEYSKPIPERDSLHIADLEEKANTLEKALARTVSGFAEARRQVNWQDVRQNLRSREAAIEFVHYQYSHPHPTDSVVYAALVLLPQDTAPHFIPLFEEKQLTALLEKTGSKADAGNLLYAARSGRLLGDKPAYGTELYKLIWKPLDSLLQKHRVKTVCFSPSGLLHRVSFGALPVNKKKVLSDRYQLHQLGSTRSLVVKTPEPVLQDFTAAVFGGVDYNLSQPATAPDSIATKVTDNRLWTYINRPKNRNDAEIFQYLDGTQTEAMQISKALQKHQIRTTTHTGTRATEEALKALGRDRVKSPDILHIATHGFFFPDPESTHTPNSSPLGGAREGAPFKWNENPLFRSGLALAGANRTWAREIDSTFTPGVIEDGIATAYEISHLNLSNTKLVVLSACETGLGDIKGSEGVYGLQRAFKMAGVDYLIVSLWKVPDPETADFMDTFYKYWLDGKTVREAFAKAQKKMRRKYKEVYKWGAWVLIG